jgi:hypothetical protein
VGDPDPIGIRELRQHASRYVDMAESGRRVPADPDLISSALLAVEARRGMLRNRPDGLPMVDLVLHDVTLLSVSDAVIESAGRSRTLSCPPSMQSTSPPPYSSARTSRPS